MLVESHVIVTDEMVTLFTAGLGSLTIAPFQPSEHRLTDMNTTVVDDIRLHYLIAVRLHDLRQRPTQQVVAHMTEVEGLVSIW